jgi:hypothetical protein
VETIALCPFAVGTVLWRGPTAAASARGDIGWTLTVCAKATFSLAHGREPVLLEKQEEVRAATSGSDDSLTYRPSDLAPFKPRTDVVLSGHAFARAPTEALVARLCVGELDKRLGVVGDRLWVEGPDGLEPSAPAPFTRLLLAYERAARAGENPVGLDLTRPPRAGQLALPNLESTNDDDDPFVGFGAIPPSWPSRRNLLNPDALAWASGAVDGPVPEGFDFGFYNVAPRDQQVGLLLMGAKLTLENLNAEHAKLETRLPQVRPKCFLLEHVTERPIEVAMRCDTLWIDTDRATLTLTWRGLTSVESPERAGTVVVAAETKGKELRFKHIERLLRGPRPDDEPLEETDQLNVRHDAVRSRSVLPPEPIEEPSTSTNRMPEEPSTHDVQSSELEEAPLSEAAPLSDDGEEVPTRIKPSNTPIPPPPSAPIPPKEPPRPATKPRAKVPSLPVAIARPPPDDDPTTRARLGPVLPLKGALLALTDYARIAVGLERGDKEKVLSQLELTAAELEEVVRVWKERAQESETLRTQLEEAIEAARWEG